MAENLEINLIIKCIKSYKKQKKVVSDISSLLSTRNAKLGILDIIKIGELLKGDKEILRVLGNVAIIIGKPQPQYHSSQTSKNDKKKWFGSIKCTTTVMYNIADKCISLNYLYNQLAQADIRSESEFFDCFMAMILVQGYSMENWTQFSSTEKVKKPNCKVDQETIYDFMRKTLHENGAELEDDLKYNQMEMMRKFIEKFRIEARNTLKEQHELERTQNEEKVKAECKMNEDESKKTLQ